MTIQHKAILGRTNEYKVDPRAIKIQDGWNPRNDFDGEAELMADIAENGVKVALRLKKVGEDIFLIDGERRLRAVMALIGQGKEIVSVPAVFEEKNISDPEALLLALSCNTGKPLDPVEEADAFRRLKAWGLPVSDIARRIGKSAVHVYRRLVLVDASPELKAEIKAKNIRLDEAEKIIKSSSGSIESQNQKTRSATKSNRMSVKEIKARIAAWDNGEYKKTDFDLGYITALRNVLDRRTFNANANPVS